MKVFDKYHPSIIKFTIKEERAFAQWLMDLLSESKWFDHRAGEFFQLVRRLYYRKCSTGKDIFGTDFVDLFDRVEKWNAKFNENFQIPHPGLLFEMDDQHFTPPLRNGAGKSYDPNQKIEIARDNTRRIWREVWLEHPRLKGTSDDYLVFPGDDPGEVHAEVQMAREVRFWGEVQRLQDEKGLSRSNARRYAEDYMVRGEFPEGDLPDPEGDEDLSLIERLEVEYPDREPDQSSEGDSEHEDENLWF